MFFFSMALISVWLRSFLSFATAHVYICQKSVILSLFHGVNYFVSVCSIQRYLPMKLICSLVWHVTYVVKP